MNNLIKLISVFGIVSCIFFSVTIKSLIRISYEINKLEIVQKFCVNKEVTEFKCDGKCYLSNQLKKTDTEQDDLPTIKEHKIQLFQIVFQSIDIISPSSIANYFHYKEGSTNSKNLPLLRPPIA